MAAVATISNVSGLIEKICVARDEGITSPNRSWCLTGS